MNTTQLIILHNDCMVELWSSCVHNSEQYDEFLLSQLFSVTQKFNLMEEKKRFFLSHTSDNSSTEDTLSIFYLWKTCESLWNDLMVLYPCTRPLAPTAARVWWLAQSLICSYRRGHVNSDPKILFWCLFFSLFFTMYLTTTLPQKKKHHQVCFWDYQMYIFFTSLHLQYMIYQ